MTISLIVRHGGWVYIFLNGFEFSFCQYNCQYHVIYSTFHIIYHTVGIPWPLCLLFSRSNTSSVYLIYFFTFFQSQCSWNETYANWNYSFTQSYVGQGGQIGRVSTASVQVFLVLIGQWGHAWLDFTGQIPLFNICSVTYNVFFLNDHKLVIGSCKRNF